MVHIYCPPNVHVPYLHELSYLDQNCRSKLCESCGPLHRLSIICVCLMVLCWKIRSTWVATLSPLSLHGTPVFSLLLLSKGYREAGRGQKREKTQNFFSLWSEQMNSGLPDLKKCVHCWERPQHCFCLLYSCLTYQQPTTSITKLLVISNYRSF